MRGVLAPPPVGKQAPAQWLPGPEAPGVACDLTRLLPRLGNLSRGTRGLLTAGGSSEGLLLVARLCMLAATKGETRGWLSMLLVAAAASSAPCGIAAPALKLPSPCEPAPSAPPAVTAQGACRSLRLLAARLSTEPLPEVWRGERSRMLGALAPESRGRRWLERRVPYTLSRLSRDIVPPPPCIPSRELRVAPLVFRRSLLRVAGLSFRSLLNSGCVAQRDDVGGP